MSNSCTIEKRHYQSGFHVEWLHSQKQDASGLKTSSIETISDLNDSTTVAAQTIAPELCGNVDSPLSECKRVEEHQTSKRAARKTENEKTRTTDRLVLSKISKPQLFDNTVTFLREEPSQELDRLATVFGIVGCVFGIAAIICLIIVLVMNNFWLTLGWLGLCLVFAIAATIFGLTAQIIFWSKGQEIPWFQWPALVICGAVIPVLVKMMIDKKNAEVN